MNKLKLILLTTAIAVTGFSMDLTLSSNSMNWEGQDFINLSISNITPGAEVDLSVFLDIDHDGIIDAAEPLLVQFNLTDGETNALGATTFVDDRDGTTNGVITSAISFFGNGALRTIGDYIWQATELDGSGTPIASDAATFSVTQTASSTWITGEVQNYVTTDTVAGAYVELQYFSDTTGTAPATWADENGEFSVYLPAGVSSADALGIYVSAAGSMSASQTPEGEFVSLAVFTNGLTIGENNLTRPLFVVPPIPSYDLVDITGTVYLIDGSETNALAGVFVEIEYPSFDDDDDVSSFDISNTNGQFSLVFPTAEDEWDSVILSCIDPLLNTRGLISAPMSIMIEGATNGIALYCYPAEALLRGTVTDLDTGAPIAGMEVELTSGSDAVGRAYTISNGTYEIGALDGSYGLQCDDDSLAQQHYVYNNEHGYRYIENLYEGEVRTGQDLAYAQGFLISGHVYTEGGAPIGGGSAILVAPGEGNWEERWNNSIVAFDGHYNLLASAGTWNVRTENKNGYYIDLYYTNCLPANRATATPIVVSNAVGGIDFYLTEGARLQGTALTADSMSMGAPVSAFCMNGSGELEFVGSGETEWGDGAFDFVVPAGSNIYLRADSDGWQTSHTWLGNVGSHNLATLILPMIGTTHSNLNIQILAGYQVSAWVKDQTSMADLPNATVSALDSASNLYAQATYQWGSWALIVPTNTPLTFFAEADGYEGEFITNTYNFADAGYFQLPVGNYQELHFVLHSSTADLDKDGLPDYLEDSVPDGIPDTADFSDPTLTDTDGDGADDYQEYVAGTDARNHGSIFKITDTTPSGSNLILRWNSVPGREYTVQLSTDLTGGSWSNIHTVVASGPETIHEPSTSIPNASYRVQVVAP